LPVVTDALPAYILDNAATAGYQRLDLMSKILDPWTRHYLGALGVGPGWQCLEVGSGNGSVAEWLCGVVGSSGSVTAVDINTVLLDLVPAQNLRVTRMDVRTGGLSANAYDLVSCRAFLHQIAGDAPAVLEKMAAAVKPGGWLLVQEPDFHLAPTTEPEVWAATWRALIEWGHDNIPTPARSRFLRPHPHVVVEAAARDLRRRAREEEQRAPCMPRAPTESRAHRPELERGLRCGTRQEPPLARR
jgi:SAM-dependent methyltransferase